MFAMSYKGGLAEDLVTLGNAYAQCGAEAKIVLETEDEATLYIAFTGYQQEEHEFFACVERRLNAAQKAVLEHAQGGYGIQFNFNLDRLHEDSSLPKEELLNEADRLTASEIYGERLEYGRR